MKTSSLIASAIALTLSGVSSLAFAENEYPTSSYYDRSTEVHHMVNYLPGHMSTIEWCDAVVGELVHRNAACEESSSQLLFPGAVVMRIQGIHWNTFASVHQDVDGQWWPIAHYAESQCEVFRQQAIDVGTEPAEVECITLEESDFQ